MRFGLAHAVLVQPSDRTRLEYASRVDGIKAEMDAGFKCPPEAGGGYYGSRATGSESEGRGEGEGKRAEEQEGRGDAGVLPYRLRVGWFVAIFFGFVGGEVCIRRCCRCCCGRMYA